MGRQKLLSIVIPVYNEAANLPALYQELVKHIEQLPYSFEILFVDDGSADESALVVQRLSVQDSRVQLIQLARNFGKEAAVSAGLHSAKGAAAIILDADLQMPPSLISKFITKWEGGSEVVVGVFAERSMSPIKRFGARVFYSIMRTIAHTQITPHATDYRLLDRQVIDAFGRFTEHNRITRGLIDWMGFSRSYIHFRQAPRLHGQPTYSYRKLITLAINSFTAYSLLPLKFAGYLGGIILSLSVPLGIFLFVERFVMGDPFKWGINGTTLLATLTVFMVGVVLACLGLIALYIAHIHAEVTNRPLYVLRKRPSVIASDESAEQTKDQPATAGIEGAEAA